MLNRALRLIRIFHDKSQTELATELGISKSYLSEIESDAKGITLDLLEKYAKVFGIPASSLLLFSEKLESRDYSDKIRQTVAAKVIKMLEWIATKEKHGDKE